MRFSLMNLRASITVGGCKVTMREWTLHYFTALYYDKTSQHIILDYLAFF